MRHILTFKTIFPESSEYKHPRGYAICNFLYNELIGARFDVKNLDNYRDIAWSLDCEINKRQIFFFVGYLGTQMTDWQLIICSGMGFLDRLRGRKDENERIVLAKAIHRILSNDKRFTDLKWFSKYTDKSEDLWFNEPT
jgi:hypothetical protein